MGYSQYYTQSRKLTHKEWLNICSAARKMFAEHADILANGYGEEGTSPIVNNKYISFNGIEDGSHETCYLAKSPSESFNFCKTAYKPYDKVVVDFLKMCRHFAPDAFKLSSDGGEEVFGDPDQPYGMQYSMLPEKTE